MLIGLVGYGWAHPLEDSEKEKERMDKKATIHTLI